MRKIPKIFSIVCLSALIISSMLHSNIKYVYALNGALVTEDSTLTFDKNPSVSQAYPANSNTAKSNILDLTNVSQIYIGDIQGYYNNNGYDGDISSTFVGHCYVKAYLYDVNDNSNTPLLSSEFGWDSIYGYSSGISFSSYVLWDIESLKNMKKDVTACRIEVTCSAYSYRPGNYATCSQQYQLRCSKYVEYSITDASHFSYDYSTGYVTGWSSHSTAGGGSTWSGEVSSQPFDVSKVGSISVELLAKSAGSGGAIYLIDSEGSVVKSWQVVGSYTRTMLYWYNYQTPANRPKLTDGADSLTTKYIVTTDLTGYYTIAFRDWSYDNHKTSAKVRLNMVEKPKKPYFSGSAGSLTTLNVRVKCPKTA